MGRKQTGRRLTAHEKRVTGGRWRRIVRHVKSVLSYSHFQLLNLPHTAAEKTNAAIDASVRELAGVSRLGIVKKKRNK